MAGHLQAQGHMRAKDGALRSAKRVGGLCSVHGGLSGKWMEMHYAYVIESLEQPGRLYRGSTRNVEERLAHHNAGKCRHTSKYRPWKLKLYIAFESKELAQRFERYLKSGSGHAFANRHFWD